MSEKRKKKLSKGDDGGRSRSFSYGGPTDPEEIQEKDLDHKTRRLSLRKGVLALKRSLSKMPSTPSTPSKKESLERTRSTSNLQNGTTFDKNSKEETTPETSDIEEDSERMFVTVLEESMKKLQEAQMQEREMNKLLTSSKDDLFKAMELVGSKIRELSKELLTASPEEQTDISKRVRIMREKMLQGKAALKEFQLSKNSSQFMNALLERTEEAEQKEREMRCKKESLEKEVETLRQLQPKGDDPKGQLHSIVAQLSTKLEELERSNGEIKKQIDEKESLLREKESQLIESEHNQKIIASQKEEIELLREQLESISKKGKDDKQRKILSEPTTDSEAEMKQEESFIISRLESENRRLTTEQEEANERILEWKNKFEKEMELRKELEEKLGEIETSSLDVNKRAKGKSEEEGDEQKRKSSIDETPPSSPVIGIPADDERDLERKKEREGREMRRKEEQEKWRRENEEKRKKREEKRKQRMEEMKREDEEAQQRAIERKKRLEQIINSSPIDL